ncbi:MAG: hypothetical protein Q4D62_14605 [Planctomycetia bacterium]|nr:hypothetical protein [Planctomycetia bacterium]
MNENPHEALEKSPFSDERPILNSGEARNSEDFQEDVGSEMSADGHLPKKFQWMKGYKKEVRDVLGEIVQTVRGNEYLGSSSSETALFETTISMELPEVGTTSLRHLLPPPGDSLRRIMQEVEYAQQKEEIEENLSVSENPIWVEIVPEVEESAVSFPMAESPVFGERHDEAEVAAD